MSRSGVGGQVPTGDARSPAGSGGGSDLVGRVAIVTGGGRGIGRAIAGHLGARGASVVLAALEEDELTQTAAELAAVCPVLARVADVTDRAQVRAVVEASVEAFGRLDILVAAHGIIGPRGSVLEYTDEQFDAVLGVNLRGSFVCGQLAAQAMIDCGTEAGRLIFLTSVAALAASGSCPGYNASKAGLLGLVRSFALDLGRYGITANAIAPGWIATGMSIDHVPPSVFALEEPFELSLTGRMGSVDDIARAAGWMASPANQFLTGEQLVLDGGQTAVLSVPRGATYHRDR